MIGWGVGVLITIAGIALSYKLDAPTAPFIVVGLALTFFVLLAIRSIRHRGTTA
jgi:ABC-type Mn2+/Zn2+ transport system permease subunit